MPNGKNWRGTLVKNVQGIKFKPTLPTNLNLLRRLKQQQLQVRVVHVSLFLQLTSLGSGELNVVGPLGQHLRMAGPGPTTAVLSTSRRKRARSKTMTTSTAADKLVAAIPPAEEFPVMSSDDWNVLRTNAAPDAVLKVFGIDICFISKQLTLSRSSPTTSGVAFTLL